MAHSVEKESVKLENLDSAFTQNTHIRAAHENIRMGHIQPLFSCGLKILEF